MIITISGTPGSGKSTVGKLLTKKLKYKFMSIGDLRGEIAMKHKLTLDQLNKIGEKENWTDKEVDDELIRIGKEEDNLVIDTRLGFHFIPKSIKISLTVDLKVGAKRILQGEIRPDEKKFSSVKELVEDMNQRIKSDKFRYKKWYNIDWTENENYDLVINTANLTPQEVVKQILKYIEHKHNL